MTALAEEGDRVFETGYSNARSLVSWVLGLGANARLVGPPDLAAEMCRRLEQLRERHEEEPPGVAAQAHHQARRVQRLTAHHPQGRG